MKAPSRRPLPTPSHKHTASASSIEVPHSPTALSTSTTTSSSISSISVASSVPASSIASSSSQPPALPNRPKLGSSHTTIWSEPEQLPSYDSTISSTFREPELVPDTGDDEIPELISAEQDAWGAGSSWYQDSFSQWSDNAFVRIDGRNLYEEEKWWDPWSQASDKPGAGVLPPMLADELHSPEHTLYSVTFSNTPGQLRTSGTVQPSTENAPTDVEIRSSTTPHPDAYYCPKDHGWVILSWDYSEHLPSFFAHSFDAPTQLPRSPRRNPANCADSTGNATHHFHKYPKAVDGHFLEVPFRHDEWDAFETVKQKRRAAAVNLEDVDLDKMEEEDRMDVDDNQEGPLFDLYVCCQCTLYVVRSPEVIPAVIPRPLWDELLRDKKANPQPGKSPERSVALAMETLLMAIENKLWKGENRMLRVTRPGFQNKMGWNPTVQKVFELLGFTSDTFDTESGLRPPTTDAKLPQGEKNRVRLLRAWAEIGAWTANYERSYPSLLQHENKGYPLCVKLIPAREKYQLAIGAHPDQIPRTELSHNARSSLESLTKEWRIFGMTATTYSPDLLAFAYYAQCRCDPARTTEYFSALGRLILRFNTTGIECDLLEKVHSSESSRGRLSDEDIRSAPEYLGFGFDGILGVEYDKDVDDEFIENAWKEAVKRSWRQLEGGALQTKATAALKVLAMTRGSHQLMKVWENAQQVVITPEQAYSTLELSQDIDMDEATLIMIFQVRLDEATALQGQRMRQAMEVIAEHRDSIRLRKFLELGVDPGVIVPPIRSDIPRGINQLGNTCYLNSLLQYFYTIKDLREAVMSMNGLIVKSVDDDKLTDDDLSRHRVGGRLVTRREITRSKKFISLLANLFCDLQFSEDAAVTPALELAKLALVTSKDEEEDEDKANTDSSNDTDATLVEEGGGVTRGPSQNNNAMDVDSPSVPPRTTSPVTNGEASSSKAVVKKAPPLPPRKPVESSGSEMMFGKQHDVSECMDNCIFQIETALLKFDAITGSEDDNKTSVVKRLFYGKIKQRLASDDLQSRSSIHEKEDLFSHLPVNVNDDGVDIYDGLSAYFDDVVEFEGKKVRMEVTLVETPPLLQIQLQRVQFNRETLQPYKSQAYVKFGETIYMDRFLDSADPQKKARAKVIQGELTRCRERSRDLLSHKTGRCAPMLDYTARFLSSQARAAGVDDDLLLSLQAEQQHIGGEIEHLQVRIKALKEELEELWRDCKDAPYELTSVFIHRGSSPSFGHYFFYSRHLPTEPDSWFKYNDQDVTNIKKSEVLADTTGSTANPYLLVFARKGSEVVDTVKRLDMNLTPIS
ncbi:USP domain-containing protein [Mycena indigotica]|uniref:ubiquitinyl hydrolase 1 n=1 Tax=Mycena indigotica TaxID=2126181 RepID=A0A8H6WCD3_9AGAR|nr:USP domain-containing protein [Mycena indigotica]KAF7307239.1 USP domain-containing protein [Mycena indigotica]